MCLSLNVNLANMKICVALTLVFCSCLGSLSAQTALDEIINIDFEQERLSYILLKLDDKYAVSIRANESILPTNLVTYSFKDVTLRDALTILLFDKNLYFKEYKPDHVIIVLKEMLTDEYISTNLSRTYQSNEGSEEEQDIIQIGKEDKFGGKAIVQGSITDSRNFGPVSSALVLNQTIGDYISTDASGNFRVELEPGQYQFVINTVSHEPKSFILDIVGSDLLDISLEPKAHLIEEVVISANSSAQRTQQTILGLEQLSRKDIKELSFFMGEADVVKSVLSIAGVNTSGDGASGYNVRGGSIDQNLILQDGAIVFNPSHVLGFFSTFNPDIVRNTTLHKGHLSANYGGRIASVLDITIKDPTTEVTSIKGSVGAIASKIAVDMPLIKGKSGVLISARRTYARWMLNEVMNSRVRNSDAFFYDMNAKWMYRISPKTKIAAGYFQSRDEFSYNEEFGYGWKNRVANAEVSHLFSDNASMRFSSTLGEISNNQFVPQGLAFDLSSGVRYRQHSIDWILSKGSHVIKAGAEWIKNGIQKEVLTPREGSSIKSAVADKDSGREMALYVNDNAELGDRLSIDVGLRFSFFHQVGPSIVNTYENPIIRTKNTISQQEIIEGTIQTYSGFEPRIALRYSFSDDWSIKAAYNRGRQYLQLLSTTSTPTPVDIWQVSNRHLRPLLADSYSISTAADVGSFNMSLDLYYRRLFNTIDYKDFADLLLQSNTETQVLDGDGRARGVELAINKSSKKMNFKFSYAFARSENRIRSGQGESINAGNWYPANFDQPHTIKLFANWNTSKIDRIAINFLYNTGRPIVAPVGNYQTGGVLVPDFSTRNAFRLPAYHRLDVSYTLLLNRRKSARLKHDISLSLYNIYGRRNPFSVFFRQEGGSRTSAFRLAVIGAMIPALQYNFQF